MATFVWDPAVQWPPPAHILQNYDVVAPGGVLLSSRRDRRGEIEEENMTQPFLALITPLSSGAYPDQGLPSAPPGYWGGGAPPYPDQGLPAQPPRPTHPIAPGGRPPGIWGGPPLYPDQGLPGQPPYPSQGPGFPTNPIVIPPDAIAPAVPSQPIYWPIHPDQGLPGQQPHPEHPIVIPGDDEQNPKFEVKTAWTPEAGWTVVIVPTENAGPVPTPS